MGNQSLIGFTNNGPNSGGANWGIGSIRTGATATNGTEEAFYIGNSTGGNYVERFKIDAAGNVGIGTSAPAQKLHVNGNVRINGINANEGNGGVDRVVVADADGILKTIGAGAYAMFHARLASTQNVNGTPSTLVLSAPVATSSLYTYDTSTGNLTFTQPGNYLVSMQVSFAKVSKTNGRYLLGIKKVPEDGGYISRGSKYYSRDSTESMGNPTIGDLVNFTTVVSIPNSGYKIRFVSAIAGSAITGAVLATEEGTSGAGSVTNITVQKI